MLCGCLAVRWRRVSAYTNACAPSRYEYSRASAWLDSRGPDTDRDASFCLTNLLCQLDACFTIYSYHCVRYLYTEL